MDILTEGIDGFSRSYHDFADKRTIYGIPNMMNVVSNIFVLIPILYLLRKQSRVSLLVCIILLQRLTSVYYQLSPSDDRLVWDMIFIATGISVVLSMFIHVQYIIILYIICIISIIYWKITHNFIPYIISIYCIPIYLILTCHNKKICNIVYILVFVSILKLLFEYSDSYIYQLTNKRISGHSLKHVTTSIELSLVIIILLRLKKLK